MRYKSKASEQTQRRNHPFVVEIVVPINGFGRTLDQMHEYLHGIAYAQGRGRREGESDVTRWLFARRAHAQAFADTFDGKVVEQ